MFGILNILQDNLIDARIINVLENWMCKNSTTFKWGNLRSRSIPLATGVKQGGILSPLLFIMFVDAVLKKLKLSNIGCYVSCCNSFMYANDLILLSLSVTDLQNLVNLCVTEFAQLDLPINEAKCHCICIGPRFKAVCRDISINISV